MQKINLKQFKKMFYKDRLSCKEIADYFNATVSGVVSFRVRNDLPARGWGKADHWLKGKHHSKKTKKLLSKKITGMFAKEKNWNWKGGRYISTIGGYVMIRVPDNTPNSYRGYMKEHRYIMSKHLGRPLNSNEHIHHIDGNKTNNSIENLFLMSNSEHHKLHYPPGSKFGIHHKAL